MWEVVSTPQLTCLILLLLRRTIRGCSLPAILICEDPSIPRGGWGVGKWVRKLLSLVQAGLRGARFCQAEPQKFSPTPATASVWPAEPWPAGLLRQTMPCSCSQRPQWHPELLSVFHNLAQPPLCLGSQNLPLEGCAPRASLQFLGHTKPIPPQGLWTGVPSDWNPRFHMARFFI